MWAGNEMITHESAFLGAALPRRRADGPGRPTVDVFDSSCSWGFPLFREPHVVGSTKLGTGGLPLKGRVS